MVASYYTKVLVFLIYKLTNYYPGEIPYEIVNSSMSSSQLFNTVDLGVAFNSTILHERLYCGFKTLFCPNNTFLPIKNSTLSTICPKNDDDFVNLSTKAMDSNTFDFFNNNNLVSYSKRVLKH